jgi:hypothetical protein
VIGRDARKWSPGLGSMKKSPMQNAKQEVAESLMLQQPDTESNGQVAVMPPFSDKMNDWLSFVSLWMPQHIGTSAWHEHGPFAFWLLQATRPTKLVELGTHEGYSYLAFCQAVQRLGLDTTCYAVDTWQGDEHAGFYGEEVFTSLQRYHNEHYSGFSQLIRTTFDDAAAYFPNGSIDLLHIDGRHSYEDVKHDFTTWAPKLSDRAIVLFHDVNVRERNFGVWKFWEELRHLHPSFEFEHGYGLGVLAYGDNIPTAVKPLILATPKTRSYIRAVYARLGAAVTDRHALSLEQQEHAKLAQSLKTRDAELAAGREQMGALLQAARQESAQVRDAELAADRGHLQVIKMREASAIDQIKELQAADRDATLQIAALQEELERSRKSHVEEIRKLQGKLAEPMAVESTKMRIIQQQMRMITRLNQEIIALKHQAEPFQNLLQSTSWRITAPLRAAKIQWYRLTGSR